MDPNGGHHAMPPAQPIPGVGPPRSNAWTPSMAERAQRVSSAAWLGVTLPVEFPADDPGGPVASGRVCSAAELRAAGAKGRGGLADRFGRAHGGRPRTRARPGRPRSSLPYFAVADLAEAVARVKELGGTVVHPGDRWAICKDSEGSPFGLALATAADSHARLRSRSAGQPDRPVAHLDRVRLHRRGPWSPSQRRPAA